jgi:ABC-type Na+ transport system ATPase subunit NatA
MIEADSLTKHFKDKKRGVVHAVEDLTLRCEPGQIYGLLGANGAGKTTALRMLATLLKPTRGSARVTGHDVVAESPAVRREVGFLAASTALYGRLTARAIVKFVRACREAGKTVIYSSHVMSEIEKLCDRIGIIHDGCLVAEGTLAELQARFGETDMEEIFVKAVGGEAALLAALEAQEQS